MNNEMLINMIANFLSKKFYIKNWNLSLII